MKRILSMITVLLIMAVIFTSCSKSGKREPIVKEKTVLPTDRITLRAKNLVSGVITPITVLQSEMIYKPNDTVWVYMTTRQIQTSMAYKSSIYVSDTDAFQPYRILTK